MLNGSWSRLSAVLFVSQIFMGWSVKAGEMDESSRLRFLVQMVSSDGESCVVLEPVAPIDSEIGSRTALQSRPVSCRRLPGLRATAIASDGIRYQVYMRDELRREWIPMGEESARVLPILIPHAVDALRLQGFEAKRFLRLEHAASLDPIAKTEISASELKELLALARGTSDLYIKASQGGVFGRGVVSITAGEGLTGGTITNVGTISLEASGVPGTYFKVSTDKHGRVSSGSTTLIESDIPVLRSPGKVSGDAIQSGTVGGSASLDSKGSVRASSLSGGSVSSQIFNVYNSSNTNKVSFVASAGLDSDWSMTLPNSLPSESGQLLAADTAGRLTWVTQLKPNKISLRGQRPILVSGGDSEQPEVSVEVATTDNLGVVILAPAGGTAPGSVVQGNDPRLINGRAPSGPAGGDLAGAYPNPTVAGLQGRPIKAVEPIHGHWLNYSQVEQAWLLRFVGLSDLKNSKGEAQVPGGCTPAQTWNYNAVKDELQCVNIGIAHTAVSGLGTAATKNVGQGANSVAAGDDERFGNAVKLQGLPVSQQAPLPTQVLTWNGQHWEAQSPAIAPVRSVAGRSGDVVLSVADIAGLGSAAVRAVPVSGDALPEQVVLGSDSRLSGARPPMGTAGGDLTGSYPNPELVSVGREGIYYRVRTDAKGRVIAGQAALAPADIPGLDWSHIVSGWPTTLAGYHIEDGVRNAGATPSIATGSDEDKGPAGERGRLYVATDSRRIYSDNGSDWLLVGVAQNSGGSVTSITAGNGLLGGTITKSGVISADVGVTAGKLVQLDDKARLPAVDASQLNQINAGNLATGTLPAGRLPAFSGDVTSSVGSAQTSLARLQGRALNAQNPSSGQTLKYDGAQWTAASLLMNDLKSSVSGNLFPAPACAASQTLTWNPVTDQFLCSAIAISDSAISYKSQSANTVFAGPVSGAGVPQFRRLLAADLPADAYDAVYFKNGGNSFGQTAALGTKDSQLLQFMTGGVPRVTLDLYGNMGVGVANPQVALDVRGAVRIGNDVTCFPTKAGTLRWTGTSFQGCDGNQWLNLSAGGSAPAASKPGYAYQVNKTNMVYNTTIPWNDNVPSSSAGSEILTATITPTSANSLIELNALVHYSEPSENTTAFTLAAFQDASPRAFAAASSNLASGNCGPVSETAFLCQAHLTTVFVAGTTSPIVIRIRAGTLQGLWEINGAGGRKLGGALASTLILREVLQ